MRGFKNMNTARILTEAWLVHYNFFKEHETLGNVPPAVKMGATPIKDWAEVIRETKVIASPKRDTAINLPVSLETLGKRVLVKHKAKHPKRRPKGLRLKPRVEVSLAQMRLK